MNKAMFRRAMSGSVLGAALLAAGNVSASLLGIAPSSGVADFTFASIRIELAADGTFTMPGGTPQNFKDTNDVSWNYVDGSNGSDPSYAVNANLQLTDDGNGNVLFNSGLLQIFGEVSRFDAGNLITIGGVGELLVEFELLSLGFDPGSTAVEIETIATEGLLVNGVNSPAALDGAGFNLGETAYLVLGQSFEGLPFPGDIEGSIFPVFSQSSTTMNIIALSADEPPAQQVPVPASLPLLALGLLAMGGPNNKKSSD